MVAVAVVGVAIFAFGDSWVYCNAIESSVVFEWGKGLGDSIRWVEE